MTNGSQSILEKLLDGSESTQLPPKLEQIREDFDGELLKNSRANIVYPAMAGVIYGIPGLLAVANIHNRLSPFLFLMVAVGSIFSGVGIYIWTSGRSGGQDSLASAYDVDEKLDDWPQTFPLEEDISSIENLAEFTPNQLEVLLTEYEVISEEARYRDRLINRSTYFALAVIGAFGVIFNEASRNQIPLVLMVLSLAMFVFSMALIKYKDARDPLWQRQRDLERLVPALKGHLTAFHTIRTPERRLLDRFSMSSYLSSIYLSLTILAVGGYLVSCILLVI